MSTAEASVTTKSRKAKMVLRKLERQVETSPEPDLPQEETAPVEEPKPARKVAAKYKGETTGMRVTDYQRLTLENNFKNKRTDEQLAEDWCREFPNAIHFTARVVASARSAFNRGKLGSMVAPDTELHPYDENGNELPLKSRKSKN